MNRPEYSPPPFNPLSRHLHLRYQLSTLFGTILRVYPLRPPHVAHFSCFRCALITLSFCDTVCHVQDLNRLIPR